MVKDIIINHGNTTWGAKIKSVRNMDNCYEIRIDSRSGITLLIGEYSAGWFACLPDYGIGVGLSQYLSDTFYNTEVLMRAALNEVDAVTIAKVLAQLKDLQS
jgi:hypothetical protein